MIPSEVNKLCKGNRYCRFEGPFYQDRLLAFPADRPLFIGGCWAESFQYPEEPERFVCSRCAHRTLIYDPGTGPADKIWLLCCPFDGEPLGRETNYLLFNNSGVPVESFSQLPTKADLRGFLPRLPEEQILLAQQSGADLLSSAIRYFGQGEYTKALNLCDRVHEIEGDSRTVLGVRYRCLQRLGQQAEAQEALKKLLRFEA